MNCDRHYGFHMYCRQCANDRFETLAWLLDLGEVWTDMTVRRAGFPSLDAAERAAHRAGRGDLVSRFRSNRPGVLV